MDRREGDFLPGDRFPGKKLDFHRFRARGDVRIQKSCPVDQLDLTDPGDGIDGQKLIDLDLRPGFLPSLSTGTFLCRFLQLEIAGWQGPVAFTRLDRSEERRVGKECRARWWRTHK